MAYALNAAHNTYRFALGHYDVTLPLIIDPLLQSTYMGGTGDEHSTAMAIHPVTGDVYVVGITDNVLPDVGGAQSTPGGVVGKYDGFIARFNAALTSIGSATYFGGRKASSRLPSPFTRSEAKLFWPGTANRRRCPRFPAAHRVLWWAAV